MRRLAVSVVAALASVAAAAGPSTASVPAPTVFVLTGGGWGHGVGMCQTGAIGRAEAGQNYREILGHYYSGAQVARIY